MRDLQSVVDSLSTEEKPYVIGTFLDEIRSSYKNNDLKGDYFDNEPYWGDLNKKIQASFTGYCHSLIHEFNFQPPNWIFKRKYYLEDPYFANNAEGMLKVALLIESPNEFASRNIYFSENCMNRV